MKHTAAPQRRISPALEQRIDALAGCQGHWILIWDFAARRDGAIWDDALDRVRDSLLAYLNSYPTICA